jgi:glycosyltransferase involved in cell wall biosynthesis
MGKRYQRGSGVTSVATLVERRSQPRMATISVVVPCYNAERYLGSALASIKRQTRPPAEVLVVDDNSRDNSASIARRAGVTVLTTPRNAGPSAARNLGIHAASGDVIAFLDADDYWAPEHLDTVVGLLDRFPQAGLAFGRERRFGLWTGELDMRLPDGEPVDAFWACVRQNVVPQMGAVARRALLQAVGGYDESLRYAEDYDLWLRLSQLMPFVCTHDVTCFHRGHQTQASQQMARIAEGAFVVRHRLWVEAGRDAPEFREKMGAVLREAYDDYFGIAWRSRDREMFRAAFHLERYIPKGERVSARWRRRERLLPLYLGVTGLWDRLPQTTRDIIRAPLQTLLGVRSVDSAAR